MCSRAWPFSCDLHELNMYALLKTTVITEKGERRREGEADKEREGNEKGKQINRYAYMCRGNI